MDTTEQAIAMRVAAVVVDPTTESPVLVLRGIREPKMYLPIFIGGLEATAIATILASVPMPRPMTHDLFVQVLGEVGWDLQRVTVTDLREGTFYAELTLVGPDDRVLELDSRPSDGIALAVRSGAAIFVAPHVLEEAGGFAEEDPSGEAVATEEGEAEPGAGAESPGAAAPEAAAQDAADEAFEGALSGDDVRLEDLDPTQFGKYKM